MYQHTLPGSNEISDSSHMEESRKFVIKIYFLTLSVNYQIKEMPSPTRREGQRREGAGGVGSVYWVGVHWSCVPVERSSVVLTQ